MALTAAARKRFVTETLAPCEEYGDDHLVDLARDGDARALDILLRKYTSYARAKAKTYFLIGADREDIIQEGMIGLFKAVRDYDGTKTVSFRSFAELCITRQIITAIKGATRQKHGPLNSYVSIHRPVSDEDDGERQLVEFLATARVVDPVEQVVSSEEVDQIRRFLADILSDLEVEVLNLYLEGRAYQEIAQRLDRQAKSIDNALQRIKRKLEMFLVQRQQRLEAEQARRILEVAGFRPDDDPFELRGNGHSPADATAPNGKANRSDDLRASLRFATKTAARREAKRSQRRRTAANAG